MSMLNAAGRRELPRSDQELVLVTSPASGLKAAAQVASPGETGALADALSEAGATLAPLFGEAVIATAAPSGVEEPEPGSSDDLARFFHVDVAVEKMEALAGRLNELEEVESAYVKPPAEPAEILLDDRSVLEPDQDTAPAATPNFSSRQGYLYGAPVGIEAPWAWTQPGGRGAGIGVIDCEWGWRFTHEDLTANSAGLVGGSNHSSTDHGTAVFGEIGGDRNTFGVTGIAPDAQLGASSFVGQSSPAAIKKAADSLSAGDVILLEIHRGGPNATGSGQKGYIAIEWWPDDFAAIRYAVNKGIVVVEAAGNGWEDLDAAVYDTRPAGFPASWKNPFDLSNPSSGAVVVGAGSPPSGTHGRTTSPWNLPYVDRARCGFSNWGSRVDAQGWGWEVTSTGYGDLYAQGVLDREYTDTFSGTSSASPIVTGAIAATQGALKAAGMPLLTSQRARQLLRSTGSPQQPAPGRPVSQRIGNRPNLRQLIPAAMKQWVSNVAVRHTYALTSTQAAWAYLDGIGWRRIKTGSSDGVSNVFALCVDSQAAGRNVNAYIDKSYLYSLVQR